MNIHMQDMKNLPSTGAWYTDGDVVLCCAASFVFGAFSAVFLLLLFSLNGYV